MLGHAAYLLSIVASSDFAELGSALLLSIVDDVAAPTSPQQSCSRSRTSRSAGGFSIARDDAVAARLIIS